MGTHIIFLITEQQTWQNKKRLPTKGAMFFIQTHVKEEGQSKGRAVRGKSNKKDHRGIGSSLLIKRTNNVIKFEV